MMIKIAKNFNNYKGQGIVEYLILMAAVIAVLLLFTRSNNSSSLKGSLNKVIEMQGEDLLNISEAIFN